MSDYTKGLHKSGRRWFVFVYIFIYLFPVVTSIYFKAWPTWQQFFAAAIGVVPIYWAVGIVEAFTYMPMLGPGGSYLAFITGNLINMKIPCAINARDIVGVKSGTPENEIIATLSIATSSLVTILVLAAGVLLMIPLQPILQSPALQPAFENVVPALFGAMACKYYRQNKTVSGIVLAFMILVFSFVPSLIGSTSMMVIPSGALAILLSYLSFRKKKAAASNTQSADKGGEEA